MKVLWLCHLVINEFAEEFQIKKKPFVGWLEGMLHELKKIPEMDIGFCFPIFDEWRMKNSTHHGHRYYSFHGLKNFFRYDRAMKEEFKDILQDFQPDIIHMWGTEYCQSRAMMEACEELGIRKRVLVRLQGMPSSYIWHYALGIPRKYYDIKGEKSKSINEQLEEMKERAENEIDVIRQASYVCGRSDWGEFSTRQINPNAKFYRMDNILRSLFYVYADKWNLEQCHRHRIFVSQAHYCVKGFHFFLRAFAILAQKYPDVEVYVAGFNVFDPSSPDKSGYVQYLKDLMEEHSLQEKVHFLGLLPEREMIDEYLKAHVSVCPSTIENRANSICEAMMLGTPVIASYVGGNIGVIEHDVDGYFYPVDEFYMMAGYIDRIFQDDALALRLSHCSVKSAMKRHDRDMLREKLLSIYQEIFTP